MFRLDVIFALFTLHHWTSLSMCLIRQHTLYNYVTGWVKISSSLITQLYSCDTVRDIKSFKTNLIKIFEWLTLSNSNLFKDTEKLFHFLVIFFFLILISVGTLNILKVFRLMFWPCWNFYEWVLQIEPATINILFQSPLADNNPV